MSDETNGKRETARVDRLVDETGAPIELPENSAIAQAEATAESVGATGPTGWWRIGLLVMAALVIVLLVLQLMSGGANTDVIPGTPTVAPSDGTPVAPANP